MPTCRPNQRPAAARLPAQKLRALRQRLIARSRPRNPLLASEPLLRPVPALLKLCLLQQALQSQPGKQAPHQRLAYQKRQRRVAKRLCNRPPAAHRQQHPHHAAQPAHSHRAPPRPARPFSQRAGPPRREQLHSALHLFLIQPDRRNRARPHSAQASRSVVGQRRFQDTAHNREATASAHPTAGIPPQGALPIEGHRRTPEQRARPHPRRDHRSGAFTRSKRR